MKTDQIWRVRWKTQDVDRRRPSTNNKNLKQVFTPKVFHKLKILKKKLISLQFKNTPFHFCRCWPVEKCRLLFSTGRRQRSTSTTAFFLVDCRLLFSSRPTTPIWNPSIIWSFASCFDLQTSAIFCIFLLLEIAHWVRSPNLRAKSQKNTEPKYNNEISHGYKGP